jgi:hypothetical protein
MPKTQSAEVLREDSELLRRYGVPKRGAPEAEDIALEWEYNIRVAWDRMLAAQPGRRK